MSISDRINKINQIKKQMAVLPISKLEVAMKPATTNEDNIRKLLDADAYGYTSHLLRLIWQCIDYSDAKYDGQKITLKNGANKPTFDQFASQISYYDREMLFWSLARATFGDKLYTDHSKCSNDKCNSSFKTDIYLSKLYEHTDIPHWDRDEPFNEFLYPATYIDEESKVKYTCHMGLLSLQDDLTLSENIPFDDAKFNVDNYGNPYTPLDQFRYSVKKMEMESLLDKEFPDYFHDITEDRDEVLKAISVLNKSNIDDIVTQYYENVLKKYQLMFKLPRVCPKCNTNQELVVPLFAYFLHRFRSV